MALGGISRERFKLGVRNLTNVSRTIGFTNLPEMTSLAASVDKESNNSTAVEPIITKACRDIHADVVLSHLEYDVTSCFRSAFIEVRKTTENAAPDGFVCIKSHAVPKASSNFTIEEYRQRVRLKRGGVIVDSLFSKTSDPS